MRPSWSLPSTSLIGLKPSVPGVSNPQTARRLWQWQLLSMFIRASSSWTPSSAQLPTRARRITRGASKGRTISTQIFFVSKRGMRHGRRNLQKKATKRKRKLENIFSIGASTTWCGPFTSLLTAVVSRIIVLQMCVWWMRYVGTIVCVKRWLPCILQLRHSCDIFFKDRNTDVLKYRECQLRNI